MDDLAASHDEVVETPFSISHFLATLRAYRAVIVLSLIGVAVLYLIIAILIYLFAASERTTMLTFRLQFRGVGEGKYPNGLRFSATDIIATPILLKVFRANRLDRFTTFDKFSESVFIIEANESFERLSNEYAARLADPKLNPVDRERIEREFELKRASLPRDTYSLNYTQIDGITRVPETAVRRVLQDIISTWSEYVVRERHALDINIAPMAPEALDETPGHTDDAIVQSQVLRAKINRAIDFAYSLEDQPGAKLARMKDGTSVRDVQLGLDDLLRYRIDPLVGNMRGAPNGLPATIRFLESEMAHDQRELAARRAYAEAIRSSISLLDSKVASERTIASSKGEARPQQPEPLNETLMPQLGDSFLDRLVELTTKAEDAVFRQRLISDYGSALRVVVPAEQAVSYDQRVLDEIRRPDGGGVPKDAAAINAELADVKASARGLLVKANELHALVSRSLVPSTELITMTSPPLTRNKRGVNLSRLGLFGILVILMSLPVIILLCLVHNKVREEEIEEQALRESPATA
jgi:hypothetical protein